MTYDTFACLQGIATEVASMNVLPLWEGFVPAMESVRPTLIRLFYEKRCQLKMFIGQRANATAGDKFTAEHSVLFGQFSRGYYGIDGQLNSAPLEGP